MRDILSLAFGKLFKPVQNLPKSTFSTCSLASSGSSSSSSSSSGRFEISKIPSRSSSVATVRKQRLCTDTKPTLTNSIKASRRYIINTAPISRHYHEKVLEHYNMPRNVGTLPKTDQDVGIGLVGAPACGDVMKLAIRVDKSGRIVECKFKTFGCGSAIASSSYATELIKGLTLAEAAQIKNTVIAKDLCLPPVKLHCSMLAQDAISAAIKDYYKKNPDLKETTFEVGVKTGA